MIAFSYTNEAHTRCDVLIALTIRASMAPRCRHCQVWSTYRSTGFAEWIFPTPA